MTSVSSTNISGDEVRTQKVCKKCGYVRQDADTAPDYECPKCGAVYAKVEAALAVAEMAVKKTVVASPSKPISSPTNVSSQPRADRALRQANVGQLSSTNSVAIQIPMEYKCPHCDSNDVKKLSLIYEQGTTTISVTTKSNTLGVGMLSDDIGAGVGMSSGTSTGIQQTALSQRITPPQKNYPKLPIHPPFRGEYICVFGMLFAPFGAPIVWWFDIAGYWMTVFVSLGVMAFGWLLRFTMTSDEAQRHAEECMSVDAERQRIMEAHAMSDDPFETWNRSFMCMKCGMQFDPTRTTL